MLLKKGTVEQEIN